MWRTTAHYALSWCCRHPRSGVTLRVRRFSYWIRSKILKMGMYRAMIIAPMMPPRTAIMSGSISAGQRLGRGLDLLVVELDDLVQHLVERAGVLTDGHHLHDHRREDGMVQKWPRQRFALPHALLDVSHAPGQQRRCRWCQRRCRGPGGSARRSASIVPRLRVKRATAIFGTGRRRRAASASAGRRRCGPVRVVDLLPHREASTTRARTTKGMVACRSSDRGRRGPRGRRQEFPPRQLNISSKIGTMNSSIPVTPRIAITNTTTG